jgi:hypothetical protein
MVRGDKLEAGSKTLFLPLRFSVFAGILFSGLATLREILFSVAL